MTRPRICSEQVDDIGEKLKTFATLHSLLRTKIGKFKVEDCVKQEDLSKPDFKIEKFIIDDSHKIF